MKSNALSLRAISIVVFSLCMLSTSQAQTASQQDGSATPPRIVRKAGGVLQGAATHRVTPAYPPLARAARVSGSVVVEVTVDEEGKVMSARAVSGHPLLKDASVAAARGWRFTPTTLNGEQVKVIGTITFNFTPPSEEDIERYKEEVAASPNSVEAHLKLGEAYREMNRNEEAAATFEKAIGINPQSAKAHHALGLAYLRLYRKEDSMEHLKEAIRLDPDYIEAYFDLARMQQGLTQDENAIELYKQALSRNPKPKDSENLQTAIGFIYLKLGRHQEALEAFKQAVTINPLSGASNFGNGARMGLCMTYIKLGDKAAALAEYEILKNINQFTADRLLEEINRMP
jgi:TonB family protein